MPSAVSLAKQWPSGTGNPLLGLPIRSVYGGSWGVPLRVFLRSSYADNTSTASCWGFFIIERWLCLTISQASPSRRGSIVGVGTIVGNAVSVGHCSGVGSAQPRPKNRQPTMQSGFWACHHATYADLPGGEVSAVLHRFKNFVYLVPMPRAYGTSFLLTSQTCERRSGPVVGPRGFGSP